MNAIKKIWKYTPFWIKWLITATIGCGVVIIPYEYFFERSIVINVIGVIVIPFILLFLIPWYYQGAEINRRREMEIQQEEKKFNIDDY